MKLFFWFSFVIIAYVYLGYPLLIFILGRVRKRTYSIKTEELPYVTLVIPAYNEESCIEKKIQNSLGLDYPEGKLEIMVSSDNSTDMTEDIARRYLEKGIVLNVFRTRAGKIGVLNKSVPLARGEIIVFTDANAMYEREAVKNMVRHFSDPEVGCVSGAKIISSSSYSTSEGEGVYWRYESFLKKHESDFNSCSGADGAAYAIRKELYPFPEHKKLIMDDLAISLNIIAGGHRCIYEPEARAVEESAKNLGEEFKRKTRILIGSLNVIYSLKQLLIPVASPIFLQLVSHKLLRWFTFVFLASMFFFNCFLIKNQLYQLMLAAQIIFYALSLIGFIVLRSGQKPGKLFYIPFYFCFMNLAQAAGVVSLIFKRHEPYWERVER